MCVCVCVRESDDGVHWVHSLLRRRTLCPSMVLVSRRKPVDLLLFPKAVACVRPLGSLLQAGSRHQPEGRNAVTWWVLLMSIVTKERGSVMYKAMNRFYRARSVPSLLLHVHCSCRRHVTRASSSCIWSRTPPLPLAAMLKLAYWPLWNAFWEYPVFDLALWGQCCLWSSDAAMRSSCRPHLSCVCSGIVNVLSRREGILYIWDGAATILIIS